MNLSDFRRRSSRRCSFTSLRIRLPTTKAAALQPSHVTRYPCVIWPCHISGPSDDVTIPCAPFTWESPGLELIFSTRVPVRNAAEDCRVWERRVGVVKTPAVRSLGLCRRLCVLPRLFRALVVSPRSLFGGRSRQCHRISRTCGYFNDVPNSSWDNKSLLLIH